MNELQKSKAILEENLGRKISYFAWPYGAYDRSLAALAERAGYEAAFGTDGAQITLASSRFSLPRFHIKNDTLGGRLSALVMPVEKKRVIHARRDEKRQMPPRIKVKPALATVTSAESDTRKDNSTRMVQSEGLVPPADIPSGN
jgi:peptidoglycan/xylan/chitin deacetylase (PgdA/CDA1 family)